MWNMKWMWRVAGVVILAGCQSRDGQKEEEAASGDLFFDYRITGEEGNDSVTCFFQFRQGGPDGDAMTWPETGKLVLDDKPLIADSAGLDGSYYEVRKAINDFQGKHTVRFKNGKRQFKEEFTFRPFTLANELPETMNRKPFMIALKGLPEEATVRLVMVDTAFTSDDINGIYKVQEGRLPVTEEMLKKLSAGPVSLQIYWEERRRLKDRTPAGGWITLGYGLSREFELVD